MCLGEVVLCFIGWDLIVFIVLGVLYVVWVCLMYGKGVVGIFDDFEFDQWLNVMIIIGFCGECVVGNCECVFCNELFGRFFDEYVILVRVGYFYVGVVCCICVFGIYVGVCCDLLGIGCLWSVFDNEIGQIVG